MELDNVVVSRFMKYPVTPDGRYFVIRARLWRCTNPKIPTKRRIKLVRDLMRARRERNRAGVDKAKRALGERGPTWWRGPDFNRHLVKNTPYAEWFKAAVSAVKDEGRCKRVGGLIDRPYRRNRT